MASSFAVTSRRLYRSLLSTRNSSLLSTRNSSRTSLNFSTTINDFNEEPESDDSKPETDQNSPPSLDSDVRRPFFQRPLQDGMDAGIYKAILVGQVGQSPFQKRLKSGQAVTLFSLGTGGIRNNRRPLDDEEPREYANRCAIQWHRVVIYPERLGGVALKHVKPGSILYLEGNLETKVFTDPVTGLVRRIREIALRRDGRMVFLGEESNVEQSIQPDLKGVGYF
eukprot:TRINITY_DN324_c0_g1_i1.p1 TRINITY_DN324_c0_g1~~TRINITY_DN324_c0_g1_i1.p1  ORF type:complete len:224 (-),score=19.12 TRINITY_DN324_c0_g1_i1:289-960(-)